MFLRSVSRKPYPGKSPPLPLGSYTPNEDTNNIESSMVVNKVRWLHVWFSLSPFFVSSLFLLHVSALRAAWYFFCSTYVRSDFLNYSDTDQITNLYILSLLFLFQINDSDYNINSRESNNKNDWYVSVGIEVEMVYSF